MSNTPQESADYSDHFHNTFPNGGRTDIPIELARQIMADVIAAESDYTRDGYMPDNDTPDAILESVGERFNEILDTL